MFVLGKILPLGDKNQDATNFAKEFWGNCFTQFAIF
jgi:hypothetical protein